MRLITISDINIGLDGNNAAMNRAFSAWRMMRRFPGVLPQARHGGSVLWRTEIDVAPLALGMSTLL